MSLIKCPECGKEISDKASACPNCGCPINCNSTKIKESKQHRDNSVFIKMPFFEKGFGKNREMFVEIDNQIVWNGFSGQTSSFYVDRENTVCIYFPNVRIYPKLNWWKMFLLFICCCCFIIPGLIFSIVYLCLGKKGNLLFIKDKVNPGHRYECKCVKRDYLNGLLGDKWILSEVDFIDSID